MPPARAVFWAATLAGIGLAARSVLAEPPSLPVALAGIGIYLAILLSGVFVLRLRMYADAIVRGPDDATGVVLTFDDGPCPENTPKVLDALDEAKAKATFFVIGRKAEKHPDLVKQIVARGHAIGIHGYAHDRLFALRGTERVRRDLVKAKKVLAGILGEAPDLWRPPIGHTNPTIARVAEELDLVTIGWSVGARDGIASADPEAVVGRVSQGLEDGAIVLMHDAAERGDHTPAGPKALPGVLAAIAARNLTITPLRAWVDEEQGADEDEDEAPEKAKP